MMKNLNACDVKITWDAAAGHYVMIDTVDGHEVARGHDPAELARGAFAAGAFSVEHRYDLGACVDAAKCEENK
jgi:hypothetical protein